MDYGDDDILPFDGHDYVFRRGKDVEGGASSNAFYVTDVRILSRHDPLADQLSEAEVRVG
jgi:hypothetical protein